MSESDRKFAENVLNRIMRGSSVSGLRFFTPQLLLEGPIDIKQEAFINLSSEWDFYDSVQSEFPTSFEQLTQEQEELKIHKLREDVVERIEILSPWPHLVIYFESGRVLYMNGEDDVYEPWTAGLTRFGSDCDEWLVVACPGGDLAVWVPKNWNEIKNV